MSRSEGWSGKTKHDVPLWRLQARKHKSITRGGSFSQGGLPRKRDKAQAISMPKFKCQEQP